MKYNLGYVLFGSLPTVSFFTILSVGVGAGVPLGACIAQAPAQYGAEREVCLQAASNCETYRACSARVAAKYGRPYSGECAAQKDAGAE